MDLTFYQCNVKHAGNITGSAWNEHIAKVPSKELHSAVREWGAEH